MIIKFNNVLKYLLVFSRISIKTAIPNYSSKKPTQLSADTRLYWGVVRRKKKKVGGKSPFVCVNY